jgi:outer membrane autotransporter protein
MRSFNPYDKHCLASRCALSLALGLWTTLSAVDLGFVAISGGEDFGGTQPPLGIFLSSSETLTNLNLSSFTPTGVINSVAINVFGEALLGGEDFTGASPPLGVFLSSAGAVTNLNLSSFALTGTIYGVAINPSGMGLLGGFSETSSLPLGFLFSPPATLTPLDLSAAPSGTAMFSVAINSSGVGLLGGGVNSGLFIPPTAFLVSSSGTVTQLDLSASPSNATINSVAINSSGAGILGGTDDLSEPIGFIVSPSGAVTYLDLPSIVPAGHILAAAINDFGVGLLGGQQRGVPNSPPLGFLVSATGTVTQLNIPVVADVVIRSVAINNSGAGLLGGGTTGMPGQPVGFLLSSSGNVTQLDFSSFSVSGNIFGVAISDSGAGLAVGGAFDPANPFWFLVSPSGALTQFDLSSFSTFGTLLSVSLPSLASALTHIPTAGLEGNNLRMAKYINRCAPEEAFYFIPSIVNGTLAQALSSAAPTRNAFAVFTADNNLFLLNNAFTRHTEISRHFRQSRVEQGALLAKNVDDPLISYLLAKKQPVQPATPAVQPPKRRPYQLWGTFVGATARQKSQHQAPTFQPWTGGLLLGFDAHTSPISTYGTGAAYTHTYIHEKEGAGHSRIDQEYLLTYGMWTSNHIYGNAAIWGGLFQIHNVREISMTGFEFKSTSRPKGWQLAPHAELGYHQDYSYAAFEPFLMLDWVSNWQNSYKEKGNGPFNFKQHRQYSSFLRGELGLRIYETIEFSTWRVAFEEKASFVNKKPFHTGTVTAALVGFPCSLTVETFTTPQNLGAAGVQIIFEPKDPSYPYGSIAYDGEFGPNYQAHQVLLNLAWSF